MSPTCKISDIQAFIPIEKTFRKIRGTGEFKNILFVGNISHQPLAVFKPLQNLTLVNDNNHGMKIESNETFT